ncbi:MAG: alpha/beta fold hydrolase [Planctomycetota bacterium]
MIGVALLLVGAWAIVVGVGVVLLVRGLRRPPRKTAGVVLARGEPADPSEIDLDAQTLELRLSHGHASPGWWIAGRNSAGPLVVVCHGFGDSRYGAMAHWAPRVLPFAHAVAVYDNRGQGDSTAPDADGSLGEADDLVAVLGQLLAARPDAADRGVVLYGYSLGANTALRAAATLGQSPDTPTPRPLTGLILDSPYRRWDGPVRQVFRQHRWPRWPIVPLAGLVLRMRSRWQDTADVAANLPPGLPVLVVSTAGDELVDPADAEAIADAARQAGCDAELLAFPHGHHLSAYELDEPAYQTALDRLFKRAMR